MTTPQSENIESLLANDNETPAMWDSFVNRLAGDLHAHLYGIGGLVGVFVSRTERLLGRGLLDDEYRQIEQYCVHELKASMLQALDRQPL